MPQTKKTKVFKVHWTEIYPNKTASEGQIEKGKNPDPSSIYEQDIIVINIFVMVNIYCSA